MFRSKSEVDQYVISSLQKIKSDKERNLRALHAAQLYYKVQDFNSARKYLLMYLSEKEDSAVAHKLLGDAFEGLGQKSKAIASYKRSLELQASQPALLLKICELLCDREVEFDVTMAKYCLDRAAPLFPHAPAVFTLKEKLLTADSSVTQEDLEKLIMSELKARPTDVNVRVKLLKLHLDLKKVDLAYSHVTEVESKQLHPNSLAWYQCSTQIFKAYYGSSPKKCDWEFFIMWMSALDRLCFLSLDETNNESCDVVVITEAIYTLDQTIYLSTQKVVKAPELYLEFIRHITGQLTFHLAVLLMKRAKKESSLWKETKKMVGPLLLFSACEPANADANWCSSIKDGHRKLLNNWAHQGRCRYAQSGHLLNNLAKECQTVKMFMDKVNHFCVTDWRKRVFEKTFLSIDEVSSASSYFVTSLSYAAVPQRFHSEFSLDPSSYVQSFEINHYGSLHHLVWLGLQSLENSRSVRTCRINGVFHPTMFKNMQFSVTNLHNTGVETLNQLDVDGFLYCTIFCTGAVIEDQQMNGYNSPDKPSLLPADITPTLCTSEQAKWWTSACSISKGGGRGLGNNIKMSDLRHILQRGIEVIRGDGLPLALMVCLARTFGQRGAEAESIEELEGCESRSVDLWRIAIPILERLANNQSTSKFTSKTSLFEYAISDLMPTEVTSLLDEGRLYVASYYMKKEEHEKALETFKLIRSAQSNFNQATIYLKLAEEELSGLRGEEITSALRCKQAALVTKARNALQVARDLIKGDHSHPLHHKIKSKFIEVEDLFSRIERERAQGDGPDGAASDLSMSLNSSENSVDKLASLLTNTKQSMNPNAYSTPRRNTDNKFRQMNNNSEMANELANMQQSSNQLKLQQIMEQSKLILDRMDSIIFEQRSQRSMIEDLTAKCKSMDTDDLTAKFNSMETELKTVLADIKKEVKRPDLYNMLDDDDYNPDEILQSYSQNQLPVSQPSHQRLPMHAQRMSQVPEAQLGGVGPQYFSPRVDQMYQNSMNFFNPHATLPFVDGHTVPEYLRTLHHSKFPLQMPSMPATMAGHLNLAQVPPFQAGAVPQITQGAVPQLGPQMVPVTGAVPPMVAGGVPQLGMHGFPQKFPGLADFRGPTNVVITTSDTLPTGTPPAQPTLSVTIPPQHRLGDTSAAHQFQISLPNTQTGQTKLQFTSQRAEVVESDDTSTSSAEPSQSSEEGEKILCNIRSKLYRFADGAWKERGTGIIQIVQDKLGKVKILMRREKVLTICANHYITPEMKIESTQEKSWFWVAQDYSDGTPKFEKFNVKFRNIQEAAEFKMAFDRAQASLKTHVSGVAAVPSSASGAVTASPLGTLQHSTPNKTLESINSSGSGLYGSAASTPKDKSSILAPSRLFASNQSTTQSPASNFGTPQPANTTFGSPSLFGKSPATFGGTPQGNTGNLSNPVTSETPKSGLKFGQPSAEAPKQSFGGFTFSTTPKFSATPVTKPEQKTTIETKKTDSPFANFSFSKPGETKGFGFLGVSGGGDAPKAPESNPFGADKAPSGEQKLMFGGGSQLSDFGSLAKSGSNQESLLSKLLSDKKPSSTPNVFATAGAPVFGQTIGQLGQPSKPASSPQVDTSQETDDFVPTVDFAPVIPLPELVEVKSGEENDEAIFSERAKLFRYDKNIKEWRDRGIGVMKILKNKETGVVRLLMRREQVHKVCCNHRITNDLVLTKSKTNERAYVWAANDFSDDTNGTFQQFTIRFKTAEQGLNFDEKFRQAQAEHVAKSPSKPEQAKSSAKGNVDKPPLSSLVTKAAGSWDCDICCVNNLSTSASCVACGTPKPGSDLAKKDEKPKTTFSFGMPAVSSAPPVTNPGLATSTTSEKAQKAPPAGGFSFGIPPAESAKPEAAKFSFGVPKSEPSKPLFGVTSDSTNLDGSKPPLSAVFSHTEGSWECKDCYSRNEGNASQCVACLTQRPGVTVPKSEPSKPLFGVTADSTKSDGSKPPLSAVFSHTEGSWECKDCYSRNKGNVSQCAACQAQRPGVTVLSIGNTSVNPSQPFLFGNLGATLPSQPTNITKDVTITPVSSQKDTVSSGFLFGAGKATEASKPFSFGPSDAFGKSTFQFSMPAFDPKSSPVKNNDTASDAEVSDREDHDDSIHFQPAIPLPELVAVTTGEEEEEVLYSHRAKLYRYDGAAKEWKERGVGDVKILQHSTTGKKRLLMRREPIMKLCLNHYLNDDIVMNAKDDKSWMWYASDFSLDEKVQEQFAIRFKTSEIAQQFYEAVEQAKGKTGTAPSTGSPVDSDDDVVYVKNVTLPDELVEKARSLQLPDTFYAYLDKRPCPGCPGCKGYSDDEEETSREASVRATPQKPAFQAPTSIFGGTGLTSPAVSSKADATLFGTPRAETTGLFGSPRADTTVFSTPKASIFGGQKPDAGKDVGLSLNQPIFGSAASNFIFSTGGATFSFGQTVTSSQEKPSQQSSSQPFFSKESSFLTPDKGTSSSIFGNVSSTNSSAPTTQSSVFSKDMPTFGNIAASSPSYSSAPTASPGFLSKDSTTFGALASTNPATPPTFLTSKTDNFTWEGAGTSLFSHLATPAPSVTSVTPQEDGDAGAGDDDPEKEAAVHFEPIVPLPDKIELSTGEEDEEVLFDQRAKLYRYWTDTKEWKERGTGTMKVLKHKTTNSYRLLMRREQVHKIVCNMRITSDLVLKPLQNSETSATWTFPNLAQEYTEPQIETLALKVKNKELIDRFQSVVNDAIASLMNAP